MQGGLQKVGKGFVMFVGVAGGIRETLVIVSGAGALMLSSFITFLLDAPWYLRAPFFIGVSILALAVINHSWRLWSARQTKRNKVKVHRRNNERIGWRSRGDNIRAKNLKIRGQDTSIDSEGTDWDLEDPEIE